MGDFVRKIVENDAQLLPMQITSTPVCEFTWKFDEIAEYFDKIPRFKPGFKRLFALELAQDLLLLVGGEILHSSLYKSQT